jgi:hypothetical protein
MLNLFGYPMGSVGKSSAVYSRLRKSADSLPLATEIIRQLAAGSGNGKPHMPQDMWGLRFAR